MKTVDKNHTSSNSNISSEHLLWQEVEKLATDRIPHIRTLYNKYNYNTGLEYDDLASEYRLFLFKRSRSFNISPEMIKSTTIHGYIRHYCHNFRSSHSNIDIEHIQSIPDYTDSFLDTDDYNDMMEKVLMKFSVIPIPVMRIILDMLGASGIKLTQREAAKKYNMPLSTFSNYIKPHLDEVKRLASVDN